MAIRRGRLEAQVTVPTGGWSVSATGTGSGTATVAAGTYYLTSAAGGGSSLLAAFASALSTTTGDTVTCTISDAESSATGKVTIASSANLAITWTSTDLRNLLGFTGNLTAATSHTSTNHARMVWLPDVPKITPYGDEDAGTQMTDAAATQNGSIVRVIYGKKWTEVAPGEIVWRGVSHQKARLAGEVTTNESFEKFWEDGILGDGPGGTPGGPIRLVWDRGVDGTYETYVVKGQLLESFRPTMLHDGLVANWVIDLGNLVKQ